MKPYLLFAGDDYYPHGGVEDLKDDFDTFEEAVAAGQAHAATGVDAFGPGTKAYKWWHVVFHETMEELASGE